MSDYFDVGAHPRTGMAAVTPAAAQDADPLRVKRLASDEEIAFSIPAPVRHAPDAGYGLSFVGYSSRADMLSL